MISKYMTAQEAAQYTGFSESYLAKLRMDEGLHAGPKFFRVGLRSVRYRPQDLDDWMEQKSYGVTACSKGAQS
jgi:excisionase family DNA binding protein